MRDASFTPRACRPYLAQTNGKVQGSHRIDDEEFWSRHQFRDLHDELAVASTLNAAGHQAREANRQLHGRILRRRPEASRHAEARCHEAPGRARLPLKQRMVS
jgi:transposase